MTCVYTVLLVWAEKKYTRENMIIIMTMMMRRERGIRRKWREFIDGICEKLSIKCIGIYAWCIGINNVRGFVIGTGGKGGNKICKDTAVLQLSSEAPFYRILHLGSSSWKKRNAHYIASCVLVLLSQLGSFLVAVVQTH